MSKRKDLGLKDLEEVIKYPCSVFQQVKATYLLELIKVYEQSFTSPLTKDSSHVKIVVSQAHESLVILDAGEVASGLTFKHHATNHVFEVLLLATLPSKRRAYLASTLIYKLQLLAKERNVKVILVQA